jgi:hypothetical protein
MDDDDDDDDDIKRCRHNIWLVISTTVIISRRIKGVPKGELPACSPPNLQNRNLKNTDFVDIMISKVLRDFPFSQNEPLKLADDWYMRILKNKLMKLKKNIKIGHCD